MQHMKAQAEEVNAEKEARGEHVKRDHIRVGAVGGWQQGGYFLPEQVVAFRKKTARHLPTLPDLDGVPHSV